MVQNIIQNKGFKISNLYCDCLEFFPPEVNLDGIAKPNIISYSSLSYFDDDMRIDGTSTRKLSHNDFKDGFFMRQKVKYLDNKEYLPPPVPFKFDEERSFICNHCDCKSSSLKTFAKHNFYSKLYIQKVKSISYIKFK